MRKVMVGLLAVMFLGVSFSIGYACEITRYTGVPAGNKPLINICRSGYAVGWNPMTKNPEWVQETVSRNSIAGNYPRSIFVEDQSLPKSQRTKLGDYLNAFNRDGERLVRGHLAPADDFSGDYMAKKETFFLSNVIPQVQRCNNNGVWRMIEERVRRIAADSPQPISVITGPLYLSKTSFVGAGVMVPTHLYKVALVGKKTVAWLVPNVPLCGSSPEQYRVKTSDVEMYTRHNLFPNVVTSD